MSTLPAIVATWRDALGLVGVVVIYALAHRFIRWLDTVMHLPPTIALAGEILLWVSLATVVAGSAAHGWVTLSKELKKEHPKKESE